MLFLLGVIYGTISLFVNKSLSIYPYAAALIAVVAMLLTHLSKNKLSRFLMSIGCILMDSVYHAYIVHQGEPLIASLYFSQFAFALYPRVLFDMREKKYLFLAVTISITLIIIQPALNNRVNTISFGA